MYIPTGYSLARFLLQTVNDPDPMMVTLGLDVGASAGTEADQADAIAEIYQDTMVPGHASTYTFLGAQVSFGRGAGDPNTVFAARSVAGGGGASPPPNNTAVLVRKVTTEGGRANRGRMYIPGFVGEADVDSAGYMSGATTTDRQAYLTGFYTALTTASAPLDGMTPVVLHGDELLAPTPIVSFSVQTQVATQRRRMRR